MNLIKNLFCKHEWERKYSYSETDRTIYPEKEFHYYELKCNKCKREKNIEFTAMKWDFVSLEKQML